MPGVSFGFSCGKIPIPTVWKPVFRGTIRSFATLREKEIVLIPDSVSLQPVAKLDRNNVATYGEPSNSRVSFPPSSLIPAGCWFDRSGIRIVRERFIGKL